MQTFKDYISKNFKNYGDIIELLIYFLFTIREYGRESHNLIGFDEREDSEFIEFFLNTKWKD